MEVGGQRGHLLYTYTDNAAFGLVGDSVAARPAFVVFPKSADREAEEPQDSFPSLWETPWVMSHEFAHHVFYTIVERHLNAAARNVYTTAEFGPNVTAFPHDLASTTSVESMARFEMDAINEGFADLFGFLSQGETSLDLAISPCLKAARAVDHANFGDETPKAFTTAIMDLLGQPTSKPCDARNNYNQTPNLADVHTVGAIFAHGMFRMLLVSRAEAEARSRLVPAWLNEFRQESLRLGNKREERGATLRAAVLALIRVVGTPSNAGDQPPSLASDQCQVLDQLFPALVTPTDLETFGCNAND
jgi:hypothetical protein